MAFLILIAALLLLSSLLGCTSFAFKNTGKGSAPGIYIEANGATVVDCVVSSNRGRGIDINGEFAAVIDLLVKAGYDEEKAAQLITRKLMAAGVAPPTGGDARGWKRLLFWRADLSFGIASPEAKEESRSFTCELEAIPPGERVRRVLDEQLWDRRRPFRAPAAAVL